MLNQQSKRRNRLGPGRGWREQGFSLWEMAILLGLLGVMMVAGFALLQSRRAYQINRERTAQLSAGDRALAGFIAEKGRLPCPDTSGNGLEDCSGTDQKGWLPIVTLGLSSSAPARGVARLKYIVYRGASANLTVLSDRYIPFRYSSLLDSSTTHTFVPPNLNTLDFCTGLTLATTATATPDAASAYVSGASGAITHVAYALAESGIDRDGDGNLFDGLNASLTAPVLESPFHPSDKDYDDLVQARSFSDLSDALACPQATRSVDAVSHAIEVGVTVTDFKFANLTNAGVLTLNAGIATAMNITSAALTVGALIAGNVVLAEATAELAAATASCVVVVGCAIIPQATAAVVAATAGLAIGVAAVVAYGVALPLNEAAVVAAMIATAKAGAAFVPLPVASPDILTQLQTSATAALNKAIAAEAAAATARTAANTALANYNTNVNSLYSVAHGYDSAHSNDPLLAATLAAYVTYAQAQVAASNADGYAQAQRLKANKVAAEIPAAIAERDAAVADAQANPTDLKKQALATNWTNAVINLQTRATSLAAAATLAEQDAATKAQAALTAYGNYTTARTAALNAFSDTTTPPNPSPRTDVSAALDSAVNSYFAANSNDNYLSKDLAATSLESAATAARSNATALQKAHDDLAASTGTTTTGGPPLGTFTTDILQRADAKGALQ